MRRGVVTGGVMLGMFLGALEATVMGTAMPTVVAQLGGLEHYSWVFTAYVLTSTATVPLWGRLSDLYGRRRIYLIGMLIFLAGSALGGVAQSMPALIAFRALQGLGAGAIVPVGLTIIGEIYTPAERARMQALFSGVWGVGSILGPLVGGWLTDTLSWRWVFFMNLPFGIAAAAVLGATYAESRLNARVAVDWLGGTLLCLAIAAFLAGLSGVTDPRWPWFAASLALAAAFYAVERRVDEPILPFDLLRDREMAAIMATAFLAGMAIFGAIAFIPLFVRGVFGASATTAGTTLTPLMLGWVFSAILGARLMLRVGTRRTVLSGLAMMTVGFALLAGVGPETPRALLLADVAVLGAGTGLAMLTLLLAAQQAVPRERLGLATSLNLFSRSIGGAVGVALMGAIFVSRLRGFASAIGAGGAVGAAGAEGAAGAAGAEDVERLLASGVSIPPEVFAAALQPVFASGVVIALVALAVATRLPRYPAPSAGGTPSTDSEPSAGAAPAAGGEPSRDASADPPGDVSGRDTGRRGRSACPGRRA